MSNATVILESLLGVMLLIFVQFWFVVRADTKRREKQRETGYDGIDNATQKLGKL